MTAAARQRAYRQRLREGAMVARVDIGGDVLTALEYLGWTDKTGEPNETELRGLLSRALQEWARSTCPFLG